MYKNLRFCILTILLGCSSMAFATGTGDYRSHGSGDWSAPATWQRYNGAAWVAAVTAPTATDGVITILTGDSVIVTNTTDTTFADQLVVKTGAVLEIKTTMFVLLNGAGTDLQAQGRLMVDVGANLSNRSNVLSDRATIYYTGDTLMQSGGLTPDLTFAGTHTQLIFGSGYFGIITINNHNNVVIKNGNSFGKTIFTNGKIIAQEGPYVFSQYSQPFSGAGPTHYIDGKVLFIAYDNSVITFAIPLGLNDRYLPVTFKTQKSDQNETHYTLQLIDGAHTPLTLPNTIASVSSSRYLTVTTDRPDNLVSANLNLAYDALDNVSDSARLRVVKSDGGNWVNVGGSGKGSPNGKISTSAAITALGDFALATIPTTSLPLNRAITSGNNGMADVYKLTTNGDGRVRLIIKPTGSNAINVKMLDKDSSTVISSNDVAVDSTGTGGSTGLAAGIYYVVVTPSNMSAPYSYFLSDSLFLPTEANNIEPDSTRALARALALNNQTTGHLGFYYNVHRDTTDWYKVTTTQDGLLQFNFSSVAGYAINLTLYDNDGTTVLGTANTSGTATKLFTKDGLAAGTYYVTLKMVNPALFSTYILADTLVLPVTGNNTEPDSTLALASSMGVNTNVGGHINYYYNNHRDTLDWYSIVLPSAGSLQLSLTSNNSFAVSVKLLNSTGTTVITTFNASGNTTKTVTKTGLAAGTYYIVVSSASSTSFEPYTVANVFTPSGGFAASDATTVDEAAKKDLPGISTSVYPNPAVSQLHILYDATVVKTVLLKDMNGRTVWSEQKLAGQQHSIADVSKLPQGMYLLQVVNKDGTVTTKKVVISR